MFVIIVIENLFIPHRNELFGVLPLGLPLARNLGFFVQSEFGEIRVVDNFIQHNIGFLPHQSAVVHVEESGGEGGGLLLDSPQGGSVEHRGGEGGGASHQAAPAKGKGTKHLEEGGRKGEGDERRKERMGKERKKNEKTRRKERGIKNERKRDRKMRDIE